MFGLFKKRNQRNEFETLVNNALSDNVLTDDEYNEIIRKAEEYNIDKSRINELRSNHFEKAIKPIKDSILSEMKMSPEQEQEMIAIAKAHGVEFQLSAKFIKCRALWAFENDPNWEPEAFDTGLVLQNKETVINVVDNLPFAFNQKMVCKFLQISTHQYKVWKHNLRYKCAHSLIGFCTKRYPHQISNAEIKILKSITARRRFNSWSLSSIWGYGIKKGMLSRSTAFNYFLLPFSMS